MKIPLDRNSKTPLYRQIHAFLHHKIVSGTLAEGTRLHSSRKLASDLGVNRITVNNAYAELEAEGLIYSRLGSGTYVAPLPGRHTYFQDEDAHARQWPIWQQILSRKPHLPTHREIQRIGIVFDTPEDSISFSGGIGAEELYPIRDFRNAFQNVFYHDKHQALKYGEAQGYLPLRATISHILSSQGISAYPEEVLVTSGSQQAIVLVASLLLRPGDTVLLESPTYPGAIDIFSSFGAHLVGVPVDENGMRVEDMEELLRKVHPSLIYTIPTFHNPTGTCMSTSRRRQLISLAERYNVPILEDDFVGDLRYEGRTHPALKTLDPGGMVIYTGTFSKMLMPALRIGYLVASGPVYDWLLERKQMIDLATSNLVQRALEAYISVGRYEINLNRARKVYRERRDAMLSALDNYIPEGTHWITPKGGIFIWLRLPGDLSANDLYPLAKREGVLYAPGTMFSPGEGESSCLRLNFSIQRPEKIEEGIRRLGRAIERTYEQQSNEGGTSLPAKEKNSARDQVL